MSMDMHMYQLCISAEKILGFANKLLKWERSFPALKVMKNYALWYL